MVKIFIGNLGDTGAITSNDLREAFEKYGPVTESECVKNYAFVHMQYKKDADDALRDLNGVVLKGIKIKVQMSEKQDLPRTSNQSIKLFVGNLSEVTTKEELKALFENYTKVLEADVVKNYGFVHIDAEDGKNKLDYIFQELNDYNLNGNEIRVQQSTSSVRQKPGMQGDLCYRCGHGGHWSNECTEYLEQSVSRSQGDNCVAFRQLRGLKHGTGFGPIRNTVGSSVGLNTRHFQNPYPQRMFSAQITDRSIMESTQLSRYSDYVEATKMQQMTRTFPYGQMVNQQQLQFAGSLPQSNSIPINFQDASQMVFNSNNFVTSSHVAPNSSAQLHTLDLNERFGYSSIDRSDASINGMQYHNHAMGNIGSSFIQSTNATPGPVASYRTMGVSDSSGFDLSRNIIY